MARRRNHKKKVASRKAPALLPMAVRAAYDAAQTTVENSNHWLLADSLSPNAAANPAVRATLRTRSRYEVANNSYAKGIIKTLADDCIGTGPRLQVLTDNHELNDFVEREFNAWACAVRLASKLRTARTAKAKDGESFSQIVNNKQLSTPVKLDFKLFEADLCTTPYRLEAINNQLIVDGIHLDIDGNPQFYYISKNHPNDITYGLDGYMRVLAGYIMHWFNEDRPGQMRGVPEITSALPLFSQLRRFTLAVLASAETAADFAAVLQTTCPAGDEAAATKPMDVVKLEKRMATVLPEGWELSQIDAKQPTSTYAEFKRELLNEIARCFNMPFNIAAGNSSGYNYASGRLDDQRYKKSIKIEQSEIIGVMVDPLFYAWCNEARLFYPELKKLPAYVSHQWFFDGSGSDDPLKNAVANDKELKNHSTTLADVYAAKGQDWRVKLKQRAAEYDYCRELGLPVEQANTVTN